VRAPEELRADLLIHFWESGVLEGSGASQRTGTRGVAVGKTLVIAAVCAVIPLIGNVVASFLTTWTGVKTWLVVPVVGVVVAMITALIQAFGSAPADEHPPPPARGYPPGRGSPGGREYPPGRGYPPGYGYPPYQVRSRRRTPLWRALLIAVLVIGVGGAAATEGIRYAVGYFTGNEPGTSRLAEPASASSEGLTLTVESVTYTAHFTQVGVAASNQTGTSLTLPLFDNCVFVGGDGTTLQADAFRSRWSETLAPGSLQRGVITFSGHLPAQVLEASLSFSNIFGRLGGGSITVHSIKLTPG
jgi:hypothetical protein